MATQINTQNIYVVDTSLVFKIPSSYDASWNSLTVLLAVEGSNTGVSVAYTPDYDTMTVTINESLNVGDVVVVRLVPTFEKLFEKATRQALTSTQVNNLYNHCLGSASAANDKILAEYGVVATGSVAEEDIALQEDLLALELEVDLNTDEINRVTDGVLARLDLIEAGGTGGLDLFGSSNAQALAGTDNATFMTPLRVREAADWYDLKSMYLTVLPTTTSYNGSNDDILTIGLPKILDGMFIKDLEVNVGVNSSQNSMVLTVKQDATVIATATLDQGVTYVDASDPDVGLGVAAFDSSKSLTVSLANENREITGLSFVITAGNTSTRYTP